MPTIGERIKAARIRKVMGQAELARAAGISPVTLFRIETGAHTPRPVTIRKIAAALGVDAAELALGAEEEARAA
jgi:transcriptional regulator with XRE-family HTH domain